MARIKMNLADVQVGGPRWPVGRHLAELIDVEEGESKAGKPMLTWEWEGVEGEVEGMTIRSFTSLQENALFGLKGHLLGLQVEDPDDVDLDTEDLVGTKAYLIIGTNKYKDRESGEEREASSIQSVEPYVKSKKTKAKKTKTKAKAKRRDEADDEDDDEDDLPF